MTNLVGVLMVASGIKGEPFHFGVALSNADGMISRLAFLSQCWSRWSPGRAQGWTGPNWLRVDGLVIWMAVHEAALYWFLHLVHV